MFDQTLCEVAFHCTAADCGIIIVDHGSRVQRSNELLLDVVEVFRRQSPFSTVEPAHMELASPSIADAYQRCVNSGAKAIIVVPFFLLPGRHWQNDIPRLSSEAAQQHPGIPHLVAAPLGPHHLIGQIMLSRIAACLNQASGQGTACELCVDQNHCAIHSGQ